MRDIIEIPDLCIVRESVVYELFANINFNNGVLPDSSRFV